MAYIQRAGPHSSFSTAWSLRLRRVASCEGPVHIAMVDNPAREDEGALQLATWPVTATQFWLYYVVILLLGEERNLGKWLERPVSEREGRSADAMFGCDPQSPDPRPMTCSIRAVAGSRAGGAPASPGLGGFPDCRCRCGPRRGILVGGIPRRWLVFKSNHPPFFHFHLRRAESWSSKSFAQYDSSQRHQIGALRSVDAPGSSPHRASRRYRYFGCRNSPCVNDSVEPKSSGF